MVLFKLLNEMMQRQCATVFRAGDARTRKQVGVTAAVRCDLAQKIVIRIWRADEDRRDIMP